MELVPKMDGIVSFMVLRVVIFCDPFTNSQFYQRHTTARKLQNYDSQLSRANYCFFFFAFVDTS